MLTRTHITALIVLILIVWAGALLVLGIDIQAEHLKPFSVSVALVFAVSAGFNKWFWKWKIFKGWFVQRPNLEGTWRVLLQSSWVDPTTQEGARVECIAVIRQTFSMLSLRLFTKESSSFLVAHKLLLQDDGVYQLAAVYQNAPSVHFRGERSEIHFGSMLLEVHGDPPVSLEGHYWTDRETKGSMRLFDRHKTYVSSYEEGATHYNFSDK